MSYNRQKVIDIAISQLGYHEKNSNDQLDDFSANSGDQNWNKYARDLDALGTFYNGRKNIGPNGLWCDIFVDWCGSFSDICYVTVVDPPEEANEEEI